MIKKFKHKGLKKLFSSGSASGIKPEQHRRIEMILDLLETASSYEDMNLPGLRLHQLKGDRQGVLSVMVSGNWRITFQFEGNHVTNVNYEDYH